MTRAALGIARETGLSRRGSDMYVFGEDEGCLRDVVKIGRVTFLVEVDEAQIKVGAKCTSSDE